MRICGHTQVRGGHSDFHGPPEPDHQAGDIRGSDTGDGLLPAGRGKRAWDFSYYCPESTQAQAHRALRPPVRRGSYHIIVNIQDRDGHQLLRPELPWHCDFKRCLSRSTKKCLLRVVIRQEQLLFMTWWRENEKFVAAQCPQVTSQCPVNCFLDKPAQFSSSLLWDLLNHNVTMYL